MKELKCLCDNCFRTSGRNEVLTMGLGGNKDCDICGSTCNAILGYNWVWAELNVYTFELYGYNGNIIAENMHQALYKIIDVYFTLPYPDQELVRIDIKCKLKKD